MMFLKDALLTNGFCDKDTELVQFRRAKDSELYSIDIKHLSDFADK
jgi:hypothetical protein